MGLMVAVQLKIRLLCPFKTKVVQPSYVVSGRENSFSVVSISTLDQDLFDES